MKAIQEIIKEYAVADEERRLYLFLSHRDLRQEFGAIEASGWRAKKKTVDKPDAVASVKTAWNRVFGRCQGWLRYCCPDR